VQKRFAVNILSGGGAAGEVVRNGEKTRARE
jgi:hypothetical protein